MSSTILKGVFGDASSTTEVGERFEAYKSKLASAIAESDSGKTRFIPKRGIVRSGNFDSLAQRAADITKSLNPEDAAQLSQVMTDMRAEIGKDITYAGPQGGASTTQLVPYDLEAPAKEMYPKFTPLRNQLSRVKGHGGAREFKRILGVTNSGMGGVPDVSPFFNSETAQTSFGSLALRRGAKISYDADDKAVPYVEMSLSDMVTYKAQFAGVGFEDMRQLSQHSLLWAHLLGEEKALLYGRGTATGYAGAVPTPAALATGNVTQNSSGGSIPAGTYQYQITAKAGFGESVASTPYAGAAVTGTTNQLVVTLPTAGAPTGSFNLYIGPSGAVAYQGTYQSGQVVTLNTLTTGTRLPPAVDSSADPNAYDGFLTVQAVPGNGGYLTALNGPMAATPTTLGGSTMKGGVPGADFQLAFAGLWNTVYADPDEIWTTAAVRNSLGNSLVADGSANYRINLQDSGGKVLGQMVTGIVNQSSPTSKILDLNVHPYMPPGNALIRSTSLPFPDSNVGETSQVIAVQDYMSVDWPQIQFTYDQSTYWFGTLIHYAPAWNGLITGIVAT